MNTIEIKLPGIEAKLDEIIALLKQTPQCADCAKNVAEAAVASTAAALRQATQDAPEPAQVTEDTTEEETPAEATETAQETPAQPAVTHADIQKKVIELTKAGKKAEVRDAVLAYNNVNVSGIPEDKLAEVMAKLTALEG